MVQNNVGLRVELNNMIEFEEISERLKMHIVYYQELLEELEVVSSDIQDIVYDLNNFEFDISIKGGDG